MFKLQPFMVDPNFRADDEKSVKEMSDNLRQQIVENLLFNVMFGNLSGDDIRLVLDRGRAISLAILHTIATSRVPNRSQLAKRLGMGTESVNRIIFMLLGMGLLSDTSIITASEGQYYVTPKGRALLRLLGIIKSEVSNDSMRSELIYILKYLRIEPPRLTSIISLMSLDDSPLNHSNIDNLIDFLNDDIIEWSEQEIGSFLLNSTVASANKWPNQMAFMRLVWMVGDLEKVWDIDLRDQTFETPSWEKDPRYPWEKDSAYFTALEYPLANKIYLKKLFFR
jgi:predicted transcriptional regulator